MFVPWTMIDDSNSVCESAGEVFFFSFLSDKTDDLMETDDKMGKNK